MLECARVFAAIAIATVLLRRLEDVSPFVRNNLHLLVGALFLLAAIRLSERRPGGLPRHGLALGGLLVPDETAPLADTPFSWLTDLARAVLRALPSCFRELAVALAVCAVVFPPFVLGFYLWHGPARSFVWLPQRDWLAFFATQVIVVALPEEALFRGYFQTLLNDAWPERVRVLGASLSLRALVTQALLFALLHFVVDLQVARLAVFFPALLFGWLTARRSGIGAAIFVHAFSNLLSDVLVRGWL
jgi:membrane protease YdiL (CAAX protease family)